MTRINCTPPAELSNLHLLAEYRELPRVFGYVRRCVDRGVTPEDPGRYVLGAGHVKFFAWRLGYLAHRQSALVEELQGRGFNPQFTAGLAAQFQDIPDHYWAHWTPDETALVVNRARI